MRNCRSSSARPAPKAKSRAAMPALPRSWRRSPARSSASCCPRATAGSCGSPTACRSRSDATSTRREPAPPPSRAGLGRGGRPPRPLRGRVCTLGERTDRRRGPALPERFCGAHSKLMPKENKNLVVALDIGTSKVACLVAELAPDGTLEILGMGSHESKGLKKGVVVNIEATVTAIQRALEEAELMADCKIAHAYVGIAGSHIRSFNSTGMVAVKDREVGPLDVDRALETARAVNIPTDQQILHVLRQEFIIDGQEDVREPIGMSGVRLEVKVHIVTGAVSA